MNNFCYLLCVAKFLRVKVPNQPDSHTVTKERKTHTAPIVFVKILVKRTGKKPNHRKADRTLTVEALVDSGASDTVTTQICASQLKLKLNNSEQKFITAGRLADSSCQTEKLNFKMPEINPSREMVHSFQVLEMPSPRYDIIIGRDLTMELG